MGVTKIFDDGKGKGNHLESGQRPINQICGGLGEIRRASWYMSTSNREFIPSSPYIGIRPPSDIAKRDRSKVVYGFPLSYEWPQNRYHHEVELEASEGAPVETRGAYLSKFAWYLSGMCQKIHRVKCTTTVVQTSGYGNGLAIIENPGWYPRA